MTNEYTPSTDEVYDAFVWLSAGDNEGAQEAAREDFDRWLAGVKAEALREAVEADAITIPDALGYKVHAVAVEDLLDRADQIEKEKTDE